MDGEWEQSPPSHMESGNRVIPHTWRVGTESSLTHGEWEQFHPSHMDSGNSVIPNKWRVGTVSSLTHGEWEQSHPSLIESGKYFTIYLKACHPRWSFIAIASFSRYHCVWGSFGWRGEGVGEVEGGYKIGCAMFFTATFPPPLQRTRGGLRREEQGCGVKVEKTSGKKLNKRGVKNSYMHFLLSLIIILV